MDTITTSETAKMAGLTIINICKMAQASGLDITDSAAVAAFIQTQMTAAVAASRKQLEEAEA